jgi:hypothetical protein
VDEVSRGSVRQRLSRAEAKLRAARLLAGAGEVDDAISRAYYAAFHAAQAALLALGHSARSHEGVVTLFGLHLIETGRLDRRLGRGLHRLRGDRESGDYATATFFAAEDASEAIRSAEEILGAVRAWLSAEFPGEPV